MDYPLRTLAYLAEIVHAPRQHQVAELQKLHAAMFGTEQALYPNFALIPGGAMLSTPAAASNVVSALTVLPDRVQLREELTGISREDFQARLAQVANLAFQVLQVGQLLAQNFVVRTLVNPRNFYDSREFVARSLLNMEEEDFGCLERKPEILGVRLVFPQTPDNRGMFNVRVESYASDPRSLFIENVGVFRSVVHPTNMDDLTSNFFATYDYIDGNLVDFIAQFDGKEEES